MGECRFRAVLVHGVGLDDRSFEALAGELSAAGVDVVSFRRRGYDGRRPTDELGRHVADLVEVIDRCPRPPTVVVGVSGGATLGLALALTGHPSVRLAVLHEPLLGPVAAEQHAAITTSISSLSSDPDADAVAAFLERLVSPSTWDRLDPEFRARAAGHEAAVRTEAPGFGAFQVDLDDLANAPIPVVWTVGRHSPPWRHAAAAIAAGAGIRVIEVDAGHSPHLEDPAAYARIVLDVGVVR